MSCKECEELYKGLTIENEKLKDLGDKYRALTAELAEAKEKLSVAGKDIEYLHEARENLNQRLRSYEHETETIKEMKVELSLAKKERDEMRAALERFIKLKKSFDGSKYCEATAPEIIIKRSAYEDAVEYALKLQHDRKDQGEG